MLEKQSKRGLSWGLHIIRNIILKDLLKCVCVGIGVYNRKRGSSKFYYLRKSLIHCRLNMKCIDELAKPDVKLPEVFLVE